MARRASRGSRGGKSYTSRPARSRRPARSSVSRGSGRGGRQQTVKVQIEMVPPGINRVITPTDALRPDAPKKAKF